MQIRDSILGSKTPKNLRTTGKDPDNKMTALSPQISALSLRHSIEDTILSPRPSHSNEKHKHSQDVKFSIQLETPPVIMYGTPEESSGALISGICDVDLSECGGFDGVVDLLDVSMTIVQRIIRTVPPNVAKKLPTGLETHNVLATWDILKHPHILASQKFSYPFSHLLPGTLPPTTCTQLFQIKYMIRASATTKDGKTHEYSLPLPIKRSVVGVTEKTSVRIFPPTTLSLSMILPTACFPNSNVHAEMRVEGLISDTNHGTAMKYKRWQLKRINWRVDESVKLKWGDKPEEEYEHRETLSYGAHKSGWKTDYSLQKGHIEFSTANFCPGTLDRVNKDLCDPIAGLNVSHQLICELLIAEEVLANPTAKQGMLSGSARVLRMQFGFPVVDRPGLGISWDDEVPPMYADIPLSPPEYHEISDQFGREHNASTMVFSPMLTSTMSPTLRHLDPTIKGFEPNQPLNSLFSVTNSPLLPTMSNSSISMGLDLAPSKSAPPFSRSQDSSSTSLSLSTSSSESPLHPSDSNSGKQDQQRRSHTRLPSTVQAPAKLKHHI